MDPGPPPSLADAASAGQADDATVDNGDSRRPGRPLQGDAIGEVAGRYVVIEEIGRGAMGRVLRAYDPKLQREVALKEVHGGGPEGDGLLRLVAEARAMAKLSHPNVVAVFDVAELPDGALLLAMELVDGTSLGTWLRAEPRPWPEVLAVFVRAGRGLAAAHQAGLLHRDFKPGNVVMGRDGAVKVTDFGVAKRLTDDVPSSSSLASSMSSQWSSVSSEELTAVGVVLGTPRYMAPEQYIAGALTPATDQYAFCLALWEALCGAPPFSARGYRELAKAKVKGPPPWSGPKIPRRIVDALLRGLSPDASKRWPSMDELLEVLAWDPRRHRRVWQLGTAAVGLIAVGTAGWYVRGTLLAERCSGAREQLAAAWGPERRAAVRDAMLAVEVAFAAGAWERTSGSLDRYAEAWIDAHTEACEATTVRGEQSTEVMDLRIGCLQAARADLQAVTTQLADADAEVLSNAHRLTAGLPELSRCADLLALRSEVEPPAQAEREAVEAIEEGLAEVRAQLEAGRYRDAVPSIQAAVQAVESLEYGPIRTKVALLEGRVLLSQGEYRPAEGALRRALESAARWGQRPLMADITNHLVYLIGTKQHHYQRALQLERLARGLSHDDPVKRGALLHNLGTVYSTAGELAKAEALEREALALRVETLGPEHPEVAATRTNLGNTLAEVGRFEESRRMYEEALAIAERTLGPTHPDAALTMHAMALALQDEGKLAESEALSRRALEVWEAALGPEHPDVARGLAAVGFVLTEQGHMTEGESFMRRALAIRERTLGPEHPEVGRSYSNLASNLSGQGRYDEAMVCFQRSLEIQERALGKDHYEVATARANVGIFMTYAGRPEDAEPVLREGIEGMVAVLGPRHHDVARARLNLASTVMMMHEPVRAELEARPAVAALESQLSADNPELALAWLTLGVILQEQMRFEEAERELLRALAVAEAVHGAEHPMVVAIRQNLGVCALGQGRADQALALAEQAWVTRQRDDVPAEYRGETAFLLAKAQLAAGGRAALPKARRTAKQALEAFERASEGFADDADEVRRWLSEHPVGRSSHEGLQ